MHNVLIVSNSDSATTFFVEILNNINCGEVSISESLEQAQERLRTQVFDLVIICFDNGAKLATQVASTGFTQVMLIISQENFKPLSSLSERLGIIIIPKPINQAFLITALRLTKYSHKKMAHLHEQNSKLTQKIEDIKIIDRAKCILISYFNMNEPQAHKYIEKQAMDLRKTKLSVAQRILKTYEN